MNHKGFTVIEVLLLIFIIMVLGGVGWYVWQAKNKTDKNFKDSDSANSSTILYATRRTGPTADWYWYGNREGDFALYHPTLWVRASNLENCTPGLFMVGGNEDSAGKCATESFGQITVYSQEGVHTIQSELRDGYTNVVRHDAPTADGIIGAKMSGEAVGQQQESEIGTTGLPDGTEVTVYIFYEPDDNRTYTATYIQLDSYPNVLSDFDRMVTDTLRFESSIPED